MRYGQQENKVAAKNWIEAGKPCIYRSGLAYRGARAKSITREKALELLPMYSFSLGFEILNWAKEDGELVLEFNKLSELDLE